MSDPRVTIAGAAVGRLVDGSEILPRQDFNWSSPQVVVLVGANGSGKTTLLRAVAGLDSHVGGLTINNCSPTDRTMRGRIAFCPSTPVVFPDMTVFQQCRYVAHLHGCAELSDHWWDLLDALGFPTDLLDRRPVAFSAGETQKASLLLALSRPFDVALFDEPLTSLDQASAAGFVKWLINYNTRHDVVIVCASHEPMLIDVADTVHQLISA